MFNVFLKKHVDEINRQQGPKGCLLVYKGFPLDFVFNIGREFAFLNEPEQVFSDNKIDLQKVADYSKETIKKLLTIDSGTYVATYEELLAIVERVQDLSLFEGKIVVLNNNLFEQYPNQTTCDFPNLDHVVEGGDLSYQENGLLNQFYVYSDVKFGLPLLQYREIDTSRYENVVTKEFFDGELVGSQGLDYETVDADQVAEDAILVTEQDEDYFFLKYALFGIKKPAARSINLITDLVTLRNEKQQRELQILKFVYTRNGYKFNIQVESARLSTQYRQEFKDILLRYWGSSSFRELVFYKDLDRTTEKYAIEQGALIEEIVQEVEKAINNPRDNKVFSDIFITSPTGAGKSLLFQVPAIYLEHKYSLVTIIVSPLIALMYDQVVALRSKGIESVAYINSTISLVEREKIVDNIKKGKISILYLSPELLLSYDVRQFIGERSIGLLVIDEAHLVTTWGRDFRVDYWYLGTYIKRLRKYMGSRFPVLALTATAVYSGPDDIVFETVESLNMQAPKLRIGTIRRDEINFDLRSFPVKGSHELVKLNKTKEIVTSNIENGIKTIVYFPWINQIKLLMEDLPERYKCRVGEYYGDVEKTRKQIVADKFQKGDILVVLATKAFGMGIDVSDIQVIYHHAPSGNLSDYVQEIGRVARTRDIRGTAATDFCPKDLKFTKILYGLSSIKQYQVRCVLQKIRDLYQKHGKRQMLVSVEDFGFIFSDSGGPERLETKVKSALLLLEKDLYRKVNNQYNVLIVRPKTLFSTVFASIPEDIEDRFMAKYGKYCKKVSTRGDNTRRDTNTLTRTDVGDIYELEMDKIWEKYFGDESFPKVKYKFFNRELFTEFGDQPYPRYKLEIALEHTPQATLRRVEDCFAALDEAFGDFGNKSFSSEELNGRLHRQFNDEVLARRITNLLTNLYSGGFELNQFGSKKLEKGTFLHTERSDSGQQVFRINSSRYIEEKGYIIRKFGLMFDTNQKSFEKFLASSGTESEYRIKIAYLIESFLLGSYELKGGKLSQIFIRINDPYKVRLLAGDPKYSNSIVQDIERRHERSVEQMESFFLSLMGNNERWDYIERYFLGRLED